jgi:hypothetical protein
VETGIRIGDTPARVSQILGQPPKQEYHAKTGSRLYEYDASVPTRMVLPAKTRHDYFISDTWYYRGVYVFHHERLWSIRFLAARDANGPELW